MTKCIATIVLLVFCLQEARSQENDSTVTKDNPGMLQSQGTISLSGVVVDNNGDPVPGVFIGIQGASTGVVTDLDGNFTINVPYGSEIAVSFIGFSSFTFKTDQYKNLKIDIETGVIEFCCTNHDPAHCASTIKEMEKLARKYNCVFK